MSNQDNTEKAVRSTHTPGGARPLDYDAVRAELRDFRRAERDRRLRAGKPIKPRNRREWALWRQGQGLVTDDDPGAA